MKELAQKAAADFQTRYGSAPECVSWAPGRLEVLGNHTDYNGGYVLSVALDRGIVAAACRSSERAVALWSNTLDQGTRIELDAFTATPESWSNYPIGVLDQLRRSGATIEGMNLLFDSNLPVGAGASSSAAIELATSEVAYGLFGGRPDSPMKEAQLCQRAEVEFVGVPCGLLDQFSSRFGRKSHALFLDCRTLEYAQLPLDDSIAVVIADSGVKHELVDGEYARLRRHCENAVVRLKELLGRDVEQLRDVEVAEFLEVADKLDPEDARRAEHVLMENVRVLEGIHALENGDVAHLGRLMVASHESSRDLFGNSVAELDFLIETASNTEGFIGGKLSGGGFGGVTANFVHSKQLKSFSESMKEAFRCRYSRDLRLITTAVGDGARIVEVPPT